MTCSSAARLTPCPSVSRSGTWYVTWRAEVAQHRHEQRGRSLPVHVEVAPDADRLACPDRPADARDRPAHARQGQRRCGGVEIGIEEGAGLVPGRVMPRRASASATSGCPPTAADSGGGTADGRWFIHGRRNRRSPHPRVPARTRSPRSARSRCRGPSRSPARALRIVRVLFVEQPGLDPPVAQRAVRAEAAAPRVVRLREIVVSASPGNRRPTSPAR